MNKILRRIAPFSIVLLSGSPSLAQQDPAPEAAPPSADAPPAPPPPPAAPPQQPQAQAQAPQPSEEAPPPASQWVYSYPTGQWVFSAQDGWLWVPAGTTSAAVDGVPYTYLYTPGFGWNWYISPWGVGAYRYGLWVRHPWRPVGWHGGWVAGPHVFVRLGGHAAYRGRFMGHGGGGAHVVVHGGGTRVVVRGGGGGWHGGGGGHRR